MEICRSKKCVGLKKMRAGGSVNWILGIGSRNDKAVKKSKSGVKHIFFLIFLPTFSIKGKM